MADGLQRVTAKKNFKLADISPWEMGDFIFGLSIRHALRKHNDNEYFCSLNEFVIHGSCVHFHLLSQFLHELRSFFLIFMLS